MTQRKDFIDFAELFLEQRIAILDEKLLNLSQNFRGVIENANVQASFLRKFNELKKDISVFGCCSSLFDLDALAHRPL